jgi:hypothetical protein
MYEYNTAGKLIKKAMTYSRRGKPESEEVTTNTYNVQGDRTSTKTVKDGQTIWNYNWEHKYDAKGNRIQTAHIKAGKPEYVEVLKLLYYKQ